MLWMLLILLGLATAGDVVLAKLYVNAEKKLATETQKYEGFVAGVKVVGKEQEDKSAKQKLADIKAKERVDEENVVLRAANQRNIAKLRANADSARGSFVPAAPAGSASPQRACFDRPQLERTLRDFATGIRGLVDEGSDAVSNLNSVKKWANP